MSRLIPGTPVIWQGRSWVLLDIPAIDQVLIRDPVSGQTELVSPNELKTDRPLNAGAHGLMSISNQEWTQAWNRFQAIRPLLDRGPRQRTRQEIEVVAKSFGKDPAQCIAGSLNGNKVKLFLHWLKNGAVTTEGFVCQ